MAPKRKRAPPARAANDTDSELIEQSPRDKVVATTELLENILSYLPTKDLLTYRKLSKRVKGIIDGSLILRETMFLRPTRAAREAWRLDVVGKGFHSVRPVAGMIPMSGDNTRGLRIARHLQNTTHLLNARRSQKTSPRMPHLTRTPAILNPLFPFVLDDGSRDEPDYICTNDIIHRVRGGNPNQQGGWWATLQPMDELNERELGGTIAERD
jgi:hypothetical protein